MADQASEAPSRIEITSFDSEGRTSVLADCLFIRSVSTAVFHVRMRLSHRWLTMALIVAVLGLASPVAHAQTNQWTWMGGSSTFTSSDNEVVGQGGVYGSGPCCAPGGRSGAAHWTDANGNLWLFGGQGFDGNGTFGYLNDLWTYNPTYNEWTFISGSITVPQFNGGQPGNSTSFFNSTPGGRSGAMSWTDANGNLWLFGGAGFDVAGNGGNLNDLWEFNINQYRWVLQGGTSTLGSAGSVAGTYGELQSFDAGSYPGSRNFGTTWTDGSGNFWLFGGYGQDSLGQSGYLNDLWEYNTANGQWAWMAGSSTIPGDFQGQSGNYGQLGAMVDSNVPGGRAESAGWKDSSGNLWLFGGNGFQPTSNGSSTSGYLNDLWEYNTSSNEWTWMGGSNFFTSNCDSLYGAVCGHAGIYGSLLQGATANIPGGRSGAALWTDASGNFWLFGGMGQDSIGATTEPLNDLWEFNPTANEWTWVSGSSTAGTDGQAGVYGSLNMAASSNAPGGREDAVGGLDQSGNFWMMGGYGLDSAGKSGYLNDLWRYQPPAQATAPIFSQSGGSYTASLSISISDTTPGAAIHYTTDGSTPSATSPVFSTAIPITATETINAIAVANGYIDSPVITETYTILQQQTVTFAPITGTQAVQTAINLSATASSGLPVTFSSSTPTVCTVSGSTASLLTSGQCGLIATQAGNNVYGQASASQNFIVHQVSQTITFSPVSSEIVGAQVTLSATATSGMPVTFSSNSPSVCTVSGNTATMMSTGNCIILGTQSGNLAYLAVSAQQVFSVTLLQQTITFQPITGTQLALTSVSLSASASSGLPVAFTSTTPTICTVSGAADLRPVRDCGLATRQQHLLSGAKRVAALRGASDHANHHLRGDPESTARNPVDVIRHDKLRPDRDLQLNHAFNVHRLRHHRNDDNRR
jgi:N-acetylneuraminic acid mutarotase